MTLRKPSLCDACKRLQRTIDGPVCSAFPEGIPDRIIIGGFDHRLPFPGDRGVRFVRDPDKPMPPGFPEERDPQEPVYITKPPEVRTQSDRQLRATAAKMIERLKDKP